MDKRTILITGASRGIGQQLALRYANPHTHLILVARDHDRLNAVASSCQQLGAESITAYIDVRDAVKLKQFILEIDQVTPIDLVIANAGIASTLQPGWQGEQEDAIHQVFTSNIQGTINTIHPLISRMISRKKGQIVLMSSLAGLRGLPQSPSYCASKAAIHIYGQSLRAWLSRYHIKVNVISPGYIKTEMSDRLTGPKPFLISSEKAARIIQKGLIKNKAHIAFPWPLWLLTSLARVFPENFINMILNQFESCAEDGAR